MRRFIFIGFLVMLVLHCGAPFYESAIDPDGTSMGLGAGVIAGYTESSIDDSLPSAYAAPGGTAYARRTFSDKLSGSLELGGWAYQPSRLGLAGSIQAGLKFRLLPEGSAKLAFGAATNYRPASRQAEWFPQFSLSYLHDFADIATGILTTGVPTGIGIGFALHPRFGDRLLGHFSTTLRWWRVPSVSIGFALEPARNLIPWIEPQESL